MSGFLLGSSSGGGTAGNAASVTTISTNNSTITSTNGNIYMDLSGGALSVNLPASPTTGEFHTFKDYKGFASANNLTINGNGNNIEQFTAVATASTLVLNINYQSVTLQWSGSSWNIV